MQPGAPQPGQPGQPQLGAPQPGQPRPDQPERDQSQPGQPSQPQPDDQRPPGLGQAVPRYGQPGLGLQPGSTPGQSPDQPTAWQPGQATSRPPQRRPAQLEPPGRELRQRAIAAAAFGALSLIALLGLGTDLRKGVYVLLFSAAVGIAGCVIGITALIKARKTGTFRPRWAVSGIVLGALAALISTPILITYLAFPTQVNNYVSCLQQAQNSSQQQACMTKFYKSIHLSTSASRAAHLSRDTSLAQPTRPR